MGKRILIVNDDDLYLEIAKKTLDREGHQTVISTDPREAEKLATTSIFDLVLIDYKMVGTNGLEFFRLIRGRAQGRIAILTGYMDDPTLVSEAAKEGIKYVISKDTL